MDSQSLDSLIMASHRRRRKFMFFPFMILALFVFSAVVMLLWNAVITPLLHVGEIGYWQAMGLLILSKILFGSWRCGHRWRRDHFDFRHSHLLHEKWLSMSDEERAKFKEELRNRYRCGWGGGQDEYKPSSGTSTPPPA